MHLREERKPRQVLTMEQRSARLPARRVTRRPAGPILPLTTFWPSPYMACPSSAPRATSAVLASGYCSQEQPAAGLGHFCKSATGNAQRWRCSAEPSPGTRLHQRGGLAVPALVDVDLLYCAVRREYLWYVRRYTAGGGGRTRCAAHAQGPQAMGGEWAAHGRRVGGSSAAEGQQRGRKRTSQRILGRPVPLLRGRTVCIPSSVTGYASWSKETLSTLPPPPPSCPDGSSAWMAAQSGSPHGTAALV